jgi:hypothetical protein
LPFQKAEEENRLQDLKALQPADTKPVHNTIKRGQSAFEIDVEDVDKKTLGGKAVAAHQSHGFNAHEQAAVAGKTVEDKPLVELEVKEAEPVETPAVETPAVETPAVETPAVETPAVAHTVSAPSAPTVGVMPSVASTVGDSKHVREVPASFEAITEEADKGKNPKPTGMGL